MWVLFLLLLSNAVTLYAVWSSLLLLYLRLGIKVGCYEGSFSQRFYMGRGIFFLFFLSLSFSFVVVNGIKLYHHFKGIPQSAKLIASTVIIIDLPYIKGDLHNLLMWKVA